MDFRDGPALAGWRREVHDFIDRNLGDERLPSLYDEVGFGGWKRDSRWRRAVAERGWLAPAWPKEFGGAGMSVMEQFVFNEELAIARAPSIGGLGVALVGPTLIAHGSDAQKRQVLPQILSGETVWCQGFSEPAAGSDLAALQTRAVRDGDEYVVNGQKIWTTMAHTANWSLLLARTDPTAPKHRGISMFLLDMATPGVTVRPILDLSGEHHLNEVFFDEVRIPAERLVGEENRGWYAATTTLDFERSSIGAAIANLQAAEDLIATGGKTATDAVRTALIDRLIESHVSRLLSYRIVEIQAAGRVPNYEASINKLFASELRQRIVATAMRLFGLRGQAGARPAKAGAYRRNYLEALSATIAAGSSEVQRNVIATRGLGLPRG